MTDPDMLPPDAVLDEEPFTDHTLLLALTAEEHDEIRGEDSPYARALRWQIEDDGGAEWAMRKLVEAEAAIAEVRDREAAYVDKIRTWANREISAGQLERRVARWRALLADYGYRVREDAGKATTWVPSGKIATSGQKPKAAIVDEAEVVAWAKETFDGARLGEVVKTTEKPMVVEVRKEVRIVDRAVGKVVLIRLACGHETAERVEIGDGSGFDKLIGTDVECVECHDPIEGPTMVTVTSIEVEEETAPAIVDSNGEIVPGLVVEAGATTVTVTPGAVR